jgi:hypothetical protein
MAFDGNKICMYEASGSYTCRRIVANPSDMYTPMQDSGLAYNVPFLARDGISRAPPLASAFSGYMLLGPGTERFTVNASQHRGTQYRNLNYAEVRTSS